MQRWRRARGGVYVDLLSDLRDRHRGPTPAGARSGLTTPLPRVGAARRLAVPRIEGDHSLDHHVGWRHKTPIIFRATEQWFCSIDRFKEDVYKAIDEVKNRFGKNALTKATGKKKPPPEGGTP